MPPPAGLAMTASLAEALGAKTAKAFETGLGLRTVADLVHHWPRRYTERGKLTPLTDLVEGEHVTVRARVESVTVRDVGGNNKYDKGKRRRMATITITDGRARLVLVWFARGDWHAGRMPVGTEGLFAGKVSRFGQTLQLVSPEALVGMELDAAGFAGRIVPLYPATARLPTWNVAKAVRTVLDVVSTGPDPLPEGVRREHGLLDLRQAVEAIHRPEDAEGLTEARRRLVWDEAMVLQVVLAQRRATARSEPGRARPGRTGGLLTAFDASSPFILTDGQREVGETLAAELARPEPMHRLLQGEVGSGKTLVALRAMLQVVDSGGQAALLAPTEVLAQQHARSLRALLGPLGQAGQLTDAGAEPAGGRSTALALLTGSLGAAARREALSAASGGLAGIVVGTHALLSEGVELADLGLVVVDEQHRFGVEQRETLRAKGAAPHVLVMTATPIPRTVAMTVYGDLEALTLTGLPAGRQPIATHVIPLAEQPGWIARAWTRVVEAVRDGHQAFVVCPQVEPTDLPTDGRRPPAAATELAPLLTAGVFAGLRVEVLHGRMRPEDKEAAMGRFAGGETEVLVATTVIEVGVDVPNATVMVILDADRFGVSQLHQLRGRVGRGKDAGLCLLVTEAPAGSHARSRLDAVAATGDGFALARVDLEQRREGNVLGTEQSGGRTAVKLLRLLEDEDVIVAARALAEQIVHDDPTLAQHPGLAVAVSALLRPDDAAYLERG